MSEGLQKLEVLHGNRKAWDRMAAQQHVLARPAKPEELREPLKIINGGGWLNGGIENWNVLCLAAGGGRHGPLYAAAGANVTVVDLSPSMLELDRQMAREFQLRIRTMETSMDELTGLRDGEFDLVVHPVSTCYLPSVDRVFQEVARVTRAEGLYISQHKQPSSLQCSLETRTGHYIVEHAYYDPKPVPPAKSPNKLREPETREFAHSWSSLIGGICRSGFTIEDVTEPMHGKAEAPNSSFHHRCYYIAPYIRFKARRLGKAEPKLVF